MNFLKNLFSGGPKAPEDRALYIYVRPKRCEEIVKVRIDTYNDLSRSDDGDGFFVRKTARAIRCPFPAEVTLTFDKNRRIVESEVTDGELVEEDDYATWEASRGS